MSSEPRRARSQTVRKNWQGELDKKPMGLRERHKLDKLERISAAAISLFGREGYEGTTLRDIAREADVALGTLSLYARDKRDLVLMIFNKVIPPLLERGRKNTNSTHRLAENMVAFFEPFYRAYAKNVTLFRIILGQVYNGPPSGHAAQNDAIRVELLGVLSDFILHAVATGECRSDVDLEIQSRSFFYLYFAAVRVWLYQEKPDPEQGLKDLSELYEHHVPSLIPPRMRKA